MMRSYQGLDRNEDVQAVMTQPSPLARLKVGQYESKHNAAETTKLDSETAASELQHTGLPKVNVRISRYDQARKHASQDTMME